MTLYNTLSTHLLTFPKAKPAVLREWVTSINDWVVSASIGILPHELRDRQDIRITLRCNYLAPQPQDNTTVSQVVCYDALMQAIQGLLDKQHYFLVETLCEAIAQKAFEDHRIREVYVKVEKIAILPQGASFGVEITRHRD